MTQDQFELLQDKYTLWDRASREGAMDLRDYNRRCAEALKQLLLDNAAALKAAASPPPVRGVTGGTGTAPVRIWSGYFEPGSGE